MLGILATGAAVAGHRVVLVRAWDEARTSGGGCCGGLDLSAVSCRPHDGRAGGHRTTREPSSAAVYRALSERFPGLDVTAVDPGNWVWLGPAVYRDARHVGRGRLAALREAARATTPGSLVVDGKVVREALDPRATVAEVARRLSGDHGRVPDA